MIFGDADVWMNVLGMWTTENRARYDRRGLRYPSDLTDAEWALIRPLIPPAKRGGNKRTVGLRAVMNGLMYLLSTGCQWAALPKDLPPRSTVNDYFRRWDWDGTLARIHHVLYVACREAVDRERGSRMAAPAARIRSPRRLRWEKACQPSAGRMALFMTDIP